MEDITGPLSLIPVWAYGQRSYIRVKMRLSGGVAVAAELCVLLALVEVAQPSVEASGGCVLSHYRSLDPRVLAAPKSLRDRYEEDTLSWRPRNCSVRPRRDPARPSSCAWLRHVARGIADAQAVLSGLRRPELVPSIGPTLELLVAAQRDVATCLQLIPPDSPRTSSRTPRRRHKARRPDSPRCREATVIFNLLRLLTRDLRLAAQSAPCV
ncbi:interferon lambda-4-like [Castor canadensis]|uniref:interferon lambda-4-like n=1 Tax=Castor canadensis TaxID=51338 RepID=UPI003D16AD72